jgi:hypothetical protein
MRKEMESNNRDYCNSRAQPDVRVSHPYLDPDQENSANHSLVMVGD